MYKFKKNVKLNENLYQIDVKRKIRKTISNLNLKENKTRIQANFEKRCHTNI